jgi:hypothetical protein
MLLATLYENYQSMDFDLDIALESPSVLCDDAKEALEWAEATIKEGRDPETEWEWTMNAESGIHIFHTECNEYGTPEDSWLVLKEIQKL